MSLGPPFHRHGKGPAGWSIKGYGGGGVPFRMHRQRIVIDDDHYLVVNRGQDYEFETPAESSLFNFTIFLSEADVRDAWISQAATEAILLDDPCAGDLAVPEFLAVTVRTPEPIRTLRRSLRTAWEARQASAEMVDAAACRIVAAAIRDQAELMGQVRNIDAARRVTREETVRRIRRAIDHIDAHLCAPLNLDNLAAVACMAKHHFLRRFKDVTGRTPYQFVLRRRIARAEALLLGTRQAAAEIGRACGFVDPASFSAAFRGLKGAPPQHWRKAQLGNFSQSDDDDNP